MEQNTNQSASQTPTSQPNGATNQNNVYINVPERSFSANSNSFGIAGFVIALVAFLLIWVPVLDWILWLLGTVFSAIGVTKMPRGLAIAGLSISVVELILILAIFA